MKKHLLHPDDDGLTALHIAAEHGHADVVLYLIRFLSNWYRRAQLIEVF